MGFSVRTKKPGAGNKNFIRTANGGWNTCIKGKPTDKQCNVLSNCVGYASGRFNEIINEVRGTSKCTYRYLNCNAENFIERALSAGLKIGSTPRAGAIMCWRKGASLKSSDGAGHVAIVEKVNSNNSVYTSESGYGGKAFWNQTRKNSNGRWGCSSNYTFRAFIYLPDDVQKVVDASFNSVTEEKKPEPVAKKSVEELAKEVIDGKWGNGDERKKRLTDAGYNYSEVQGKVNEMLKPKAPVTEEKKPEPATKPSNTTSYKVGDTVVVNGRLTATSQGTGAKTKSYKNQKAKIIMIKNGRVRPYALNMNNNMNGVTGWAEASQIRK